MSRLLLTTFLFLVGFLSACRKENPVSTGTIVIYHQDDVTWSSLANSPWPMQHGNPLSNGRSTAPGPAARQIAWTLTLDHDGIGAFSSFAIGSDSTLYVVSSVDRIRQLPSAELLAVTSDSGRVKWRVPLTPDAEPLPSEVLSGPLVANDGTIYAGTPLGDLYAVRPSGAVAWRRRLGGSIQSALTISKEGSIYVIAGDRALYAFNPNGTLAWTTSPDRGFNGTRFSGIAMSPDGQTLYVPGADTLTLYALDTDGNKRWRFDGGFNVQCTPLVDAEGIIYLGATIASADTAHVGVYAVSAGGTLLWKYASGGFDVVGPAMDRNGNLYFMSGPQQLRSIDHDGYLRWMVSVGHVSTRAPTSLICDNQNVVYAPIGGLYAISENGQVVWNSPVRGMSWSVPAIGFGGTLFAGYAGDQRAIMKLK